MRPAIRCKPGVLHEAFCGNPAAVHTRHGHGVGCAIELPCEPYAYSVACRHTCCPYRALVTPPRRYHAPHSLPLTPAPIPNSHSALGLRLHLGSLAAAGRGHVTRCSAALITAIEDPSMAAAVHTFHRTIPAPAQCGTCLKMPAAPTAWPLCAAASLARNSSSSIALRGSLGSIWRRDSHLLAALACRCIGIGDSVL